MRLPFTCLSCVVILTGIPLVADMSAAQPIIPVEGVHYQSLDVPVATTDPERIEVVEIFWYGCPRCYASLDMSEDWEAEAAGDVAFRRVPAVWNKAMATQARLFYTAQTLNALDKMHAAAFTAIHENNDSLRNEVGIMALFESQGVRGDAFQEAWNAPATSAAVEEARAATEHYGVRAVPAMIVNGKYRVTYNAAVPSHRDMQVVVNLLMKKERDARRSNQ